MRTFKKFSFLRISSARGNNQSPLALSPCKSYLVSPALSTVRQAARKGGLSDSFSSRTRFTGLKAIIKGTEAAIRRPGSLMPSRSARFLPAPFSEAPEQRAPEHDLDPAVCADLQPCACVIQSSDPGSIHPSSSLCVFRLGRRYSPSPRGNAPEGGRCVACRR